MLLTAVVTKAELTSLIVSLTPMRIVIDERRGRVVTLNRPSVELVAGQGLRLRGDARVTWDVAGMPIPVTIQTWQLLLVPRVLARPQTRVLAFDPVIEELDLKLVPGFLDDKIARAVRDGLAQNQGKLAWDFVRTLSKRLDLPVKMLPAKTFEIRAVDAGVAVSATELRLDILFAAKVEERVEAGSVAAPAAVPSRERAVRSPRAAAR